MISNNFKHIVLAVMVGCGIAAVNTACTEDWDDHYEGTASGANVHSGSLWEALQGNEQLSNFASIIETTGYNKSLNGSQVFTVFAPTNDAFSKADAEKLIAQYQAEKQKGTCEVDNSVVKEFVKNHISLYNYSVAEGKDDMITLLNGKRHSLDAAKFGDVALASTNELYGNGVLFTLKDVVAYQPNVFEYLAKDDDLKKGVGAFMYDSLLYKLVFDASQSVPDSIRDGETVYSDSVMVQVNELFDMEQLDAELNHEDSVYWMVVPTNDVWDALVAKYTPYFNYDEATWKNQSEQEQNTGSLDSLIHTQIGLSIVKGTVFSRSINTDKALQDSAMSTNAYYYSLRKYAWGADTLAYYQYMNPLTAPDGVLSGTTDVECSNGKVMKTSDWKIKPTQTFMRDIIVEAEATNTIKEVSKLLVNKDTVETVTANTIQVESDNPYYNKVSNHSYVEFTQQITTGNTQHSATFFIRDVLSAVPYDIYLQTVPALAGDTAANDLDRSKIKLYCELSYRTNKGTTKKENLGFIETEKDSVDRILIKAAHKFDVCSFGINEVEPQVTLKVNTFVSDDEMLDTADPRYQRTMRIDCILLKPHEE